MNGQFYIGDDGSLLFTIFPYVAKVIKINDKWVTATTHGVVKDRTSGYYVEKVPGFDWDYDEGSFVNDEKDAILAAILFCHQSVIECG